MGSVQPHRHDQTTVSIDELVLRDHFFWTVDALIDFSFIERITTPETPNRKIPLSCRGHCARCERTSWFSIRKATRTPVCPRTGASNRCHTKHQKKGPLAQQEDLKIKWLRNYFRIPYSYATLNWVSQRSFNLKSNDEISNDR